MASDHPLYNKSQPTNILLLTHGRKEWERDILLYTPGDREIDGLQVTDIEKPLDFRKNLVVPNPAADPSVKKVDTPDEKNIFAYLPAHFCAGHGEFVDLENQSQPNAGAGLWAFMEDHPEIGAKRGDLVGYFKCQPCLDKIFNPMIDRRQRQVLLPNNGWQRYDGNRAQTTEDHILGYLRAHRWSDSEGVFVRKED